MVSPFKILPAPQIIFGAGSRNKIAETIQLFGNRIVLVTGSHSFFASSFSGELFNQLQIAGVTLKHYAIEKEPSPKDIDEIVKKVRSKSIQVVVAIGGGSVVDAGKAISAMLKCSGPITDYLEGVGTKKHDGNKVPFIAVPTTAGTGSEVTSNAVITQPGKNGFKKSLRHYNFIPNYAIVDPELTLSCPANLTAAAGMDAFTQLVESYLSTKANDYTDALALDGISKILTSLEKAVEQGANTDARSNVQYAAMLSGITLSNAGLGIVHGFAQPLGSLFPMPHGTVCGTLMAAVNDISFKRLIDDMESYSQTISKYKKLGQMAGCSSDSSIECGTFFIEKLNELTQTFHLHLLSGFNVKRSDFDNIIELTGHKNHPIQLSRSDLESILSSRL